MAACRKQVADRPATRRDTRSLALVYEAAHTSRHHGPLPVATPKLTIEGVPSVEVASGTRLVLAIEQEAHVDFLHACGGNARCTATAREGGVAPHPDYASAIPSFSEGLTGIAGAEDVSQLRLND
jgi:hypothetical protein